MNLVFAWKWEVILPQNFCQDMQKSTISSFAKAGPVSFFIPLFPHSKSQHKIDHSKCKAFYDPWVQYYETPVGHAMTMWMNTEVPLWNKVQAKQLSQNQSEEEKSGLKKPMKLQRN